MSSNTYFNVACWFLGNVCGKLRFNTQCPCEASESSWNPDSCCKNSTYLLNIRSFMLTIFNNLFVNFLSFLTAMLPKNFANFCVNVLTFLWNVVPFFKVAYTQWALDWSTFDLVINWWKEINCGIGWAWKFKCNFTKILNPK